MHGVRRSFLPGTLQPRGGRGSSLGWPKFSAARAVIQLVSLPNATPLASPTNRHLAFTLRSAPGEPSLSQSALGVACKKSFVTVYWPVLTQRMASTYVIALSDGC